MSNEIYVTSKEKVLLDRMSPEKLGSKNWVIAILLFLTTLYFGLSFVQPVLSDYLIATILLNIAIIIILNRADVLIWHFAVAVAVPAIQLYFAKTTGSPLSVELYNFAAWARWHLLPTALFAIVTLYYLRLKRKEAKGQTIVSTG